MPSPIDTYPHRKTRPKTNSPASLRSFSSDSSFQRSGLTRNKTCQLLYVSAGKEGVFVGAWPEGLSDVVFHRGGAICARIRALGYVR